MFQQVDKYLKNQLERIVFIELKENVVMKYEDYKMLKGIPVPILVKELAESVKKQRGEQEISLAAIARAMILLIGIDSQFKYIEEYREFLYAFDANIEDYIVYEGLKAADQKEFYTAVIYFKALMLLNDENVNGLFNYARCCQDIAYLSQEKDVETDFSNEAHETLELLVEQQPDFALGYYHLGFYYANQRLFKKAQITWKKALDLRLDEEKEREIVLQLRSLKNHIQYEEGYSLILSNEPRLGLEKLIPLEEKHSEWWNLLFFIGLGYRQLNQYGQAIEYFLRILKINPTQVDTLNELGICYSSIQDYLNAEKYLKKGLQFKPNDSEILCNLGMVYMEQGNIRAAREVLEQSIRENLEDDITRICLDKLKTME